MEIEINHNPSFFEKQNWLKWDLIWKKKIKNQWFSFGCGVFTLILSILMLKDGNPVGVVFISLALFLIFVAGNFLIYAYKAKRNFKKIVKETSDLYLAKGEPCRISINEDDFQYSDFRQSLKFKWEVFEKVMVLQDTILLKIKNNAAYNFSISKEEVGEDRFKEILDFLNKKVS